MEFESYQAQLADQGPSVDDSPFDNGNDNGDTLAAIRERLGL
jgi:hypothetical protein